MTKYLKSKHHQQITEFFDPDICLPRSEKKSVSKLASVRGATEPMSRWLLSFQSKVCML